MKDVRLCRVWILWFPEGRESLRSSWHCFSKADDLVRFVKKSAASSHHLIRVALFVQGCSIESTLLCALGSIVHENHAERRVNL